MKRRKTLKELTIKNNFMFGAVMSDESNCKELLEMVLQFPIERVEISKEKSIVYHPFYKGVRLDVYARDENQTHYDVEMQAAIRPAIGKRARYYHSQIDMELLASGEEYEKLPDSYVIFVCDFDPFGKKKYCYTFANQCLEDLNLNQGDGRKTIFLSTHGENENDVPQSMVKFLKYVKADLTESEQDFGDAYVKKLQESIRHVKESREMEDRFMLFEELLKEECAEARAEGRAEGRTEGIMEGRTEGILLGKIQSLLDVLAELGELPIEVREKIETETDKEKLQMWLKLAVRAESIEDFLQVM